MPLATQELHLWHRRQRGRRLHRARGARGPRPEQPYRQQGRRLCRVCAAHPRQHAIQLRRAAMLHDGQQPANGSKGTRQHLQVRMPGAACASWARATAGQGAPWPACQHSAAPTRGSDADCAMCPALTRPRLVSSAAPTARRRLCLQRAKRPLRGARQVRWHELHVPSQHWPRAREHALQMVRGACLLRAVPPPRWRRHCAVSVWRARMGAWRRAAAHKHTLTCALLHTHTHSCAGTTQATTRGRAPPWLSVATSRRPRCPPPRPGASCPRSHTRTATAATATATTTTGSASASATRCVAAVRMRVCVCVCVGAGGGERGRWRGSAERLLQQQQRQQHPHPSKVAHALGNHCLDGGGTVCLKRSQRV
jgi:hypothetical protein